METKDDPYRILGIEKNASEEEIKTAYRKLAKCHHPDKGGDAKKFLKINDAHKLLSTPEVRRIYDQHGMEGVEMFQKTGMSPSSFGGGGMGGMGGMGGEDMFAHLFGGGGGMHKGFSFQRNEPTGPPPEKKIPDRVIELRVTPEEAYQGKTIKYRLQRRICRSKEVLPMCKGCQGKGRVATRPPGVPAFMMVPMQITVCSGCAGLGIEVNTNNMETVTEIVSIDLPMHCPLNYQHVVKGKTDEIPSFVTGDVIFRIVMNESTTTTTTVDLRTGDVVSEVAISIEEALFKGFKKKITFLDGETYNIVLPPNTSFFRNPLTSSSFPDGCRVMKEKGFYMDPLLRTQERGDWILRFTIRFPIGRTDTWFFDEQQQPSSININLNEEEENDILTTINVIQVSTLPNLLDKRDVGGGMRGGDGGGENKPGMRQEEGGGPQVVQECRTS